MGSMFKRAYTRGINDELIRLGLARFSTKEAADEIADAVGDQLPQEPAAEPVSPETAAEVAATLVDAANKLVQETQGAGLTEDAEAPMPEEAALKTSAAQDLDTRSQEQAYDCMVKAAAEAKYAEGSNIEGGDKGNSPTGAPAAETQMENKNRPEGYANLGVSGVGGTSSGAGRGTGVIGDEQPQPVQPGESPSGSNSVIQQSKMGSLRALIQKVALAHKHAEGSTIMGGDKGNTMGESPFAETQMEAANRPMGYAEHSVGTTELTVPAGANIGIEQAHPVQPGASPAGSTPPGSANSIVAQSKTSAEDPFMVLFKKTAEEVAPYLPGNMPDDEKIAHVRHMMGMDGGERTQYVAMLAKEAGALDDQAVAVATKHAEERRRYSGNPGRTDRTRSNQKQAGELPEALRAAIEKKEGKGEEKKDENPFGAHEKSETPAEEKKEEEKKEGSDLISRIRAISRSVRG